MIKRPLSNTVDVPNKGSVKGFLNWAEESL